MAEILTAQKATVWATISPCDSLKISIFNVMCFHFATGRAGRRAGASDPPRRADLRRDAEVVDVGGDGPAQHVPPPQAQRLLRGGRPRRRPAHLHIWRGVLRVAIL